MTFEYNCHTYNVHILIVIHTKTGKACTSSVFVISACISLLCEIGRNCSDWLFYLSLLLYNFQFLVWVAKLKDIIQ